MAWYGVVAEKDSVTNIDRQLKNVYGVTAVSRWAHIFQVLRKAEYVHCFGLPTTTAVTKVLLQCADDSFKTVDGLQPLPLEILQLSCQYPKEV